MAPLFTLHALQAWDGVLDGISCGGHSLCSFALPSSTGRWAPPRPSTSPASAAAGAAAGSVLHRRSKAFTAEVTTTTCSCSSSWHLVLPLKVAALILSVLGACIKHRAHVRARLPGGVASAGVAALAQWVDRHPHPSSIRKPRSCSCPSALRTCTREWHSDTGSTAHLVLPLEVLAIGVIVLVLSASVELPAHVGALFLGGIASARSATQAHGINLRGHRLHIVCTGTGASVPRENRRSVRSLRRRHRLLLLWWRVHGRRGGYHWLRLEAFEAGEVS